MNIAIVGNSVMNRELSDMLTEKGFNPVMIEELSLIRNITGEIGGYTLTTADASVDAACIVVMEELAEEKNTEAFPENAPYRTLLQTDPAELSRAAGKSAVILLDYASETTAAMTQVALEKAVAFTSRKINVLYLSRFMRTAGQGLEQLYREARNAGITFVKYETARVEYDPEDEEFCIAANDGYESFELRSPILITAEKLDLSESMKRAEKLWHAKKDKHGFFSGQSFFMSPTLTSRKGLYVINNMNGKTTDHNVFSQLQYTVDQIVTEAALAASAHAEINPGKCAFCYTCYRACAHAAMAPDHENSIMMNLNRACFGCGTCVSVCPASAITLKNSDEDGEASNVKSVKATGKIKLFCCENSAEIAFRKLQRKLIDELGAMSIEAVRVHCGGEISADMLLVSLKGCDKVVVGVCIDEACRHFEGNRRAEAQVEKANRLLRTAGLDAGRIELIKVSHAMPDVLLESVRV